MFDDGGSVYTRGIWIHATWVVCRFYIKKNLIKMYMVVLNMWCICIIYIYKEKKKLEIKKINAVAHSMYWCCYSHPIWTQTQRLVVDYSVMPWFVHWIVQHHHYKVVGQSWLLCSYYACLTKYRVISKIPSYACLLIIIPCCSNISSAAGSVQSISLLLWWLLTLPLFVVCVPLLFE